MSTTTRWPEREPLVESDRRINWRWLKSLSSLRQTVDEAPQRQMTPVELTGQSAAIGLTPLPAGTITSGYYRLSTFLRVTTAAGVSSAVQVTIFFTSGGVACSYTLSNLNTNTTTTPVSDTRLIKADGGTPISYSVTYASNPAAAMVYELTVCLEKVNA